MIYLASPYSSPIPTVVEDRYARTAAFTLQCLRQGLPVFSPIAYFHPFAERGGLPTTALYWHETNMGFLRHAEAVFVLRLTGWEHSAGMKVELDVAKVLCLPIVHYDENGQLIQ